MHQSLTVSRIVALLLVVSATLSLAAQTPKKGSKHDEMRGTPVLWERVNIPRQDLYLGPGGKSMRPDTRRITFLKEEKGGYSTKYRIKDAQDQVWVAKVGKEAQSETAAVRLLSAIGYKTEVNYLVPRLTIPGKGTFTNVRLEARPENIERGGEWKWSENPFKGTNELQGLKLMMAFFNNWDMKNANNRILETDDERQYVISDLGVSFGKTAINKFLFLRWIGRSRNAPKDYAGSKFITGVKPDRRVKIHVNGKNHRELNSITVENARWLADLLTQLSNRQIRDAFRAANYSQSDINLLTRAVRNRIVQLDRVAGGRTAIR